jgi:hypothetical protein
VRDCELLGVPECVAELLGVPERVAELLGVPERVAELLDVPERVAELVEVPVPLAVNVREPLGVLLLDGAKDVDALFDDNDVNDDEVLAVKSGAIGGVTRRIR